jgi:N-acetylglucosamine transport system permease protein
MMKFITYILLLVWLLAVTFPLVWVGVNSLRSTQEIVENPFGVPWLVAGSPHGDVEGQPTPQESAQRNFEKAWVESEFSRYFLNSLIVTSISLVLILMFGAMAAYALAKIPGLGNRMIYLYFISGMMIPAQLTLVPLFFQYSAISETLSGWLAPLGYEVQLHNSHAGLILIYIAFSLPFTILILTGFFKSLPNALRESAIMDGASEFTVFWRIMLPLARPGLITAAIFNFLGLWNEYLFALIFVNTPEKKTLPLGLSNVSLQAQYSTDYGLMFAGLVIVIVPTLLCYLVLQSQLTKGITAGALKG